MRHSQVLAKSTEQRLAHEIRYLPIPERKRVLKALVRAKEFHEGQLRDSGDAYVTHPIAVAEYLSHLEAGAEMLVAALLHDVVEDDIASLEMIEKEFGADVAKLVDGVTKLSKVQYEGSREERQVASLRKTLLTASNDLRVILIKLADRWHNIETIDAVAEEKKNRVARETLDIYVPFARLVGLWDLKQRFEEVCFPLVYPVESQSWRAAIKEKRKFLEPTRERFAHQLQEDIMGVSEAKVTHMSDYELFQQFEENIERLDDVLSFDSVLVILDSPDITDCYRVMGDIHQRYPVHVGFFRDYLSAPQANGYHALHTAVFLSKDHDVKVRIQTREMYEYTARRKISDWIWDEESDVYRALSSLHKPTYEREQYLRDLKDSVLVERIHVFTTAGELVSLPKDATGIDFAFALNPSHLSSLAGIRVNGESRDATATLQEGDTVELVLLPNARSPVRAGWVQKTKSIAAREQMKDTLRLAPKVKREREGQSLLEFEFRKRRLPVWWLFHLLSLQEELRKELGEESFTKVLEKVGTGILPISKVVDAYKKILVLSPTWTQKLLKFFHLLPRSRVLNRDASIVDLEVVAEDRQGLIYDITRRIAERKINIAKFSVYALPPKDSLYSISIEVQNFKEFSDLFDSLWQIPSVKRVLRKK
jgi:GTP pyrophosphokinase